MIMGDGDGKSSGAGFGSVGNLTVSGGAQLGRGVLGGAAGTELYIGNLPGGFDLNPVFFGDYTISDLEHPGRQDAATIPRDTYLRVDQRYVTLRAGRIPFIGGNIRNVDGAEIFLKPISNIRLGGFVGMRNETALAPDGALIHRYGGLAYGVSGEGGVGGFSARVFYQGVRDGDIRMREDVGGNVNWRIVPNLSVYARVMGSLLLHELEDAEGGMKTTLGPATVSGYGKWSDPSLLYLDANDPWMVFANQPNWRTGGDLALRLAGGAFLLHAGGYHGSLVDYGIDTGAQVGNNHFLRTDFSYAKNATVAGGGDAVSSWLTGGLHFDRVQALASVGYVQSPNRLMPLYSRGEAVGFLLTTDVRISNSWKVGGRFDGTFPTDRSPQYTALLFLQWKPGTARPAGAWGRGIGGWRNATVVPSGSAKKGDVSWVVFPVQVIDAGDYGVDLHKNHKSVDCVDCHEAVAKSKSAADNLAIVNCKGCHDDGRMIKVSIPPPHLNFPHQTHVTGQKIECKRCHDGLEEAGLATRAHLPGMSTCTSCHVTWRNECSKCHPSGPSGRMQSIFPEGKLRPTGSYGIDDNHDVDFRTNGGHRWVASIHLDYCLNCHGLSVSGPGEPKGCQECHDPWILSTNRKHPAGWTALHPAMAQTDPSSCRTCHGQSFCTDCHASQGLAGGISAVAPRSYHPSGWLSTAGGDHGRRAALGATACSPCHSVEPSASSGGMGQGTACIRCHETFANPHGSGMSGRLGKLQSVNPSLCTKCHTGSVH